MNFLYRSEGPLDSFPPFPYDQIMEVVQRLNLEIRVCIKCPLSKSRTLAVPGEGPLGAPLFIIGEAPGEEEDLSGLPFVGRAGAFLNKVLYENGIDRANVFITNGVKCRPPLNRKPKKNELLACRPYLDRQLALVQPHWVCTLGVVAMEIFLKGSLTKVHGKIHKVEYKGKMLQIFPTFHPAAVFRNPVLKEQIRKDFKILKEAMAHA